MLDFCNAHPHSRFFSNPRPELLLVALLRQSIDYFVDEDQGKCHFDSKEFRAFMEYGGSYSTWGSRTFDPIDPEESGDALYGGRILAFHTTVSSLGELKSIRGWFGDKANFVGFPNKGGSPVYRIIMDNLYFSPFAITSTSGNKADAFEFLEWYLDLDVPEYMFVEPLPLCANRKKMEEKIEKIALAGGRNVNGGEPDMTEDDLEILKILLEGIEPMPDDNFPLYKIVFMETKPYFAGDKTLDEVIEVIQNRATLYMNEK